MNEDLLRLHFALKYDACAALAIAMHDRTGWDIVVITDQSNVRDDGTAVDDAALHWTVRRPDGMLIDIDGAHVPEDLISAYAEEAEGGTAAGACTNRRNAERWHEHYHKELVSISTADTFVDAVLARTSDPRIGAKQSNAERRT